MSIFRSAMALAVVSMTTTVTALSATPASAYYSSAYDCDQAHNCTRVVRSKQMVALPDSETFAVSFYDYVSWKRTAASTITVNVQIDSNGYRSTYPYPGTGWVTQTDTIKLMGASGTFSFSNMPAGARQSGGYGVTFTTSGTDDVGFDIFDGKLSAAQASTYVHTAVAQIQLPTGTYKAFTSESAPLY